MFSCEDNLNENEESEDFSLLFIASEGNFGSVMDQLRSLKIKKGYKQLVM